MTVVLVLGSSDVGSAVAHALFKAGHRVVLHDIAHPPHPRRGMAFTDAFFDGHGELDGVVAKRAPAINGVARMLECGRAIPVTDAGLPVVLASVRPDVLVDARIHKHDLPECIRGVAPLSIGLGPGFEVGHSADVVVETAWGEDLGRVITAGRAKDLQGEPRAIEGHSRDRYVYSPAGGRFTTALAIGAHVTAGEIVARVGDAVIVAPLSGTLRGLTHDGARVRLGAKVVEVDPRGEPAAARGLGERPSRIAAGVIQAIAAIREP